MTILLTVGAQIVDLKESCERPSCLPFTVLSILVLLSLGFLHRKQSLPNLLLQI